MLNNELYSDYLLRGSMEVTGTVEDQESVYSLVIVASYPEVGDNTFPEKDLLARSTKSIGWRDVNLR